MTRTAGLAWVAATDHLAVVWWLLPACCCSAVATVRVHTGERRPDAGATAEERATASSLITEARQVGAALGVALSGLAWSAVGSQQLDVLELAGDRLLASTSVTLGVVVVAAVVVWCWMPAR